jgi:hypothetical protein
MSESQNINSEVADQIHSATIQIAKLREGTIVFIETENSLYELTVINPEKSLVSVNTSDDRFEDRMLVTIDTPIIWGDCIPMVVSEGVVLFTKKVNGASVKGDGWKYDVL